MRSLRNCLLIAHVASAILAAHANPSQLICTDPWPQVPAEAFMRADSVFIGRVDRRWLDTNGSRMRALAELHVLRAVKGVVIGDRIVIETHNDLIVGSISLGGGFHCATGDTLVAYFSHFEGEPYVDRCSRTTKISKAYADTEYFDEVLNSSNRAHVVVRVTLRSKRTNTTSVAPGVRVILSGHRVTHQSIADDNGLVDFGQLSDGEYSARVDPPHGYHAMKPTAIRVSGHDVASLKIVFDESI